MSSDDTNLPCYNHHMKSAQKYCSNCSQLLCTECLRQHLGHEFETIEDATQKYRYELQTLIDKLNERIISYGNSREKFDSLDAQLNDLENEIVRSAEDYKRLIDEHKDILINELGLIRRHNATKKEMTNASSVMKLITIARELIADGGRRDLFSFAPSALASANRFLQFDVVDVPMVNGFSFKASNLSSMARQSNIVGFICKYIEVPV
jgi:hypothetical protein